MSNDYSIKRSQNLPVSLNTAWNFFCKPENLKQIMPLGLRFTIVSPVDGSPIYRGQKITYKVTTKIGIPLSWVTEVTDVEDKQYFIDEQREGPFQLWRHQHYFIEIPGGVTVTDILHYKLRWGFLGHIAHFLFMKRRIKQIFNYRDRQLKNLFGQYIER